MVSKEFVRIYARICGDGCLSGRYIRYSNKNLNLIKEFERDIKKEFGEITLTRGITNSGTPFSQIQLKPIVKIFSDIGDYSSSKIKVPSFVKNGSRNLKREFIRTIYEDEGSPILVFFGKTKEWKRRIAITSNSRIFLEELKSLLQDEFGISTNQIIRNRINSQIDKTESLVITGRDNLLGFQNNIGFKSYLKNKEVELILESYEKTYRRNRKEFNKVLLKLNKLKNDKRKFYKQNFSKIFIDGRS